MCGVVTGCQRMLARMVRELLHRRGCAVMVQLREQAQACLGCGGTCRREFMFPSQEQVSRVTGMVGHMVSHVRVGRCVRMMRRVRLGVEVMVVLLGGRLIRGWLDPATDVTRSSGRTAASGRQFEAQIRERVRMR